MKKFLLVLLAATAIGLGTTSSAQAAGCTGSTTFLHVDCATDITATFWNTYPYFDADYTWRSRVSYQRVSNTRVFIKSDGWRNGVYGCRQTDVSGTDNSKHVYWRDGYTWNPAC